MSKFHGRLFLTSCLALAWGLGAGVGLSQQEGQTPPSVKSPDGKVIASAAGKVISLFDAATQKELVRIQGHTEPVSALAISPDGKLLASGGQDKSVRLWDPATGKELRIFRGHQAPVVFLGFSGDGKILASRDADKVTREWDLATGKLLR